MKESVIYQEIRDEGKREGRQEEGIALILRQLNRRIGVISGEIEQKIRQLPLNTLEDLGEALLDFNTEADLLNWLEIN
jgi:predicted transposase YdaD